jgi:hypothetical protein
VLGEERGAELERGLELARVNGVPDRPHPPLRDPAGEPELAGHVQPAHSRSRVRVLGGRREVEEGEKAGTARRGRVYRVGMCDGGDPMWASEEGAWSGGIWTVRGWMDGGGLSAVWPGRKMPCARNPIVGILEFWAVEFRMSGLD